MVPLAAPGAPCRGVLGHGHDYARPTRRLVRRARTLRGSPAAVDLTAPSCCSSLLCAAGARHGGARVTGQLIAGLALRHDVAVLHLADESEPAPDLELVERCSIVEAVPRPAGPVTLRTRVRFKLGLVRGFPTWASELASPRFGRRVAELAADWRPDVVQLEFPVMGQYLPALAASAAPRVLVDHDASLGPPRLGRSPGPAGWARSTSARGGGTSAG